MVTASPTTSRVLTLVFTDLADSTALKTRLGDVAGGELIARHRQHLARLAADGAGTIIDWAGDGCFLTFDTASAAVVFALRLQQIHHAEPELPGVRVGIHMGEVSLRDVGGSPRVEGLIVDLAARISGLASAGQVLVSSAVSQSARQRLGSHEFGQPIRWDNYGPYVLKGFNEPIEICAAGLQDLSPSAAPGVSEKAWPKADPQASMQTRTAANGVRGSGRFGRSARTAVGLAAIALAVGAWWLAREQFHQAPQPEYTRIAILPFEVLSSAEEARYFAKGLADQIMSTLNDHRIQVVSPDEARLLSGPERDRMIAQLGVAQILSGTVLQDGTSITVRAHLDDPLRHAVLWSKEFRGDAASGEARQAQIAHAIADLLDYANRALRPGDGLDDPALIARYIRAGDLITSSRDYDLNPRDSLELLGALREVTAQAPQFAAAHAELANFAATFAHRSPPEEAAALRQEAAEQARLSLSLDPDSQTAYVVQADLLPSGERVERERLLRQALAIDPTGRRGNFALVALLGSVGRLTDAVPFARAGAVAARSSFDAWVEGAAGASGRCIDALSKELELNPGDAQVWFLLLTCQVDAGRLDAALAMLESPSAPTSGTPLGDTLIAVTQARRTGAAADRAHARDLALALADGGLFGLNAAVMGLASLGFVDDAFGLAERYSTEDVDASWTLFLKRTAAMRRDPRLKDLARRVGLVDYWQSTGQWPDFCSEPGLPYDCRQQAAL